MDNESTEVRLDLSIIGVPDSAGSYAPGQEKAPKALRDAGLIGRLASTGISAVDCGDLPMQVWSPDLDHPFAQNSDQVLDSIVQVADRVHTELALDRRVLVLGGSCTIAMGALAGLQRAIGSQCGLIYADRHFDMNTPETTREGALDWMGLGHSLNLPGALPSLAEAFGTAPQLGPGRVSFLGVDPTQSNAFERDHVKRLGLNVTTQAELIENPTHAGHRAVEALPNEPFVAHIDVDVLDFTSVPIAENTSGRNCGPSLWHLEEAFRTVLHDPRWRVLTIGEINPTRADGIPKVLTEVNDSLSRMLRASKVL